MAKKLIAKDVDKNTLLVKGEVRYIDPEKLIPYKYNARKHQSEIDNLCNIIKTVGFPDAKAIEVDKNMVIINGHGRRLAAMKLGMKEVPYVVRDMSEELARTYRIADNKISDMSGWDFDILEMEYKDLKKMNIPLDDFGFQDMGFDETLFNTPTETVVIDEDEVTSKPITVDNTFDADAPKPRTYKLGNHMISLKAVPEIVDTLIADNDDYHIVCSDLDDFNAIIKMWEERTGNIAKKMT